LSGAKFVPSKASLQTVGFRPWGWEKRVCD
jgi:hypothetical protein